VRGRRRHGKSSVSARCRRTTCCRFLSACATPALGRSGPPGRRRGRVASACSPVTDLTAATMRAGRDSLRSRTVTRSDLQAAPWTGHSMTSQVEDFRVYDGLHCGMVLAEARGPAPCPRPAGRPTSGLTRTSVIVHNTIVKAE
jgi:hypothetical protein